MLVLLLSKLRLLRRSEKVASHASHSLVSLRHTSRAARAEKERAAALTRRRRSPPLPHRCPPSAPRSTFVRATASCSTLTGCCGNPARLQARHGRLVSSPPLCAQGVGQSGITKHSCSPQAHIGAASVVCLLIAAGGRPACVVTKVGGVGWGKGDAVPAAAASRRERQRQRVTARAVDAAASRVD